MTGARRVNASNVGLQHNESIAVTPRATVGAGKESPTAAIAETAARIAGADVATAPETAGGTDARTAVPTADAQTTVAIDGARIAVPTADAQTTAAIDGARTVALTAGTPIATAATIAAPTGAMTGATAIAIIGAATAGRIASQAGTNIPRGAIAGAIIGMATDRAAGTAIFARCTTSSTIIRAMIRSAGFMSVSATTIIRPIISMIATWWRRLSTGAAGVIRRLRSCATTLTATAISSRAAGASTAPGRRCATG